MKIFIFLLLIVSLFSFSLCTQYIITQQNSFDGMCTSDATSGIMGTFSVGDCFQASFFGGFVISNFKLVAATGGVALEDHGASSGCNNGSPSETSNTVDGSSMICADFSFQFFADFKVELAGGGGMGGDPHFTPITENKTISKMKYTPKPKEDGIYNIFSNQRFQWNSFFKKYNVLADTIHLIYQFVTGEYFIIKSPIKNGENVKISFKVVTDKTKSRSLFIQPTINQLISSQEEQKRTKGSKTMRKLIKSQTPIPFKMSNGNKRFFIFGEQHPEYFIETPNLYHVILETPFLRIKTRVTFLDLSMRSDLSEKQKRKLNEKYPRYSFPFLDTNIEVVENEGMKDSHGILGQTMRDECPYKQPHDGCVSCFMKGEPKDYRIEKDQQFGTNFKFNKFK